ncbi:MAG: FG-GAP-like repeat-containing protein [Minicystis sp.]
MVLVLAAFGLAPGCGSGDQGASPQEDVDSAEQALVHACWPPGTPPESAMCAGGFSYLLACPGNPDAEATGCGSDTQYTLPQQTLAQAQAHVAAAWTALGGQGQPVFRAPLVCTSCTDTGTSDVNGCWPAGTPDAQKICAGGYDYAIECHAKQATPACKVMGYAQKKCTDYNTCVHPDFGVASRGPRAWSTTIGGGYILVKQCYTDPETNHQDCQFVPVPNVTKNCSGVAADERAKLPEADAALVTFTTQQGPIQGDGSDEWTATCTINFNNWPTYNSGTGPVCGIKSVYSCDDLTAPIYAECRDKSHPIVPAAECGPELQKSPPGSSLEQAKSEAQNAWVAASGAGTVSFTVPPVCTSCTDVLPTPPQNGLTPGRTEGAASVTPSGGARYTMPLWVPEGRGGLKPGLALSYASGGDNGLLGVGFSLSGLSRITRCPKTLAQDFEAKDVQMDVTDRFCLDGRQLVAVGGGVYGAYGTEYRTEDNTFTKVVSLQSDGYGPVAFQAYLKDGRILTFGGDVATRVEGRRMKSARDANGAGASESLDPTVRYAWMIAREEDRAGNFIQYSYGTNAGTDWQRESERWPTEIAYVGHGPTGRAPTRFVRFSYENRPDVDEAYVAGLKIVSSRRLSGLEVWGPSPAQPAILRSYRLRYANTSISGRSQLTEVQECDATGVCKRPTRFEWSQGSWQFDRLVDKRPLEWQDQTALKSYAADAVYAADVDGHGQDSVMARITDGHSYQWAKYSYACGDSRIPGVCIQYWLLNTPTDSSAPDALWIPPPRLVDVDGDGRAEFFNITTPPGGGARRWLRWVSPAKDHDFTWENADGESSSMWTAGGIPAEPLLYFADLDGDGLPEALRTQQQGSGYIWAFRPNTNGALGEYISLPSIGAVVDAQPYTARIDDSGRTALLIAEPQVSSAGVRFLTGLRLGPNGMEQVPTTLAAYRPSSGNASYWFADVNGDGLDDALQVSSSGGTPEVIINSGRGFRSPIVPGLTPASQIGPFLPFITALARPGVFVADVDFDGKQDLVVAQNHDAELNVRTKWMVLSLRGNTWVPRELDVPLGDISSRGPVHTVLLDWNGDGLTDIAQAEKDTEGKRKLVIYQRKGPRPDLLQAVVDGADARSEFIYGVARGTNIAKDLTFRSAPPLGPTQSPVRPSMTVVRALRVDDGVGGMSRYTYGYADGRRDALRGWLGFRVQTVKDEQTGAVTFTEYDVSQRVGNAYPSAGQPVYQRTWVTLESGWTHVTEALTQYDTIQEENGKIRFAYPQRTVSAVVDLPPGQAVPTSYGWLEGAPMSASVVTGGTEVQNAYDADGNLTTSSLKRLDHGQYTGEELVTTTIYRTRDPGRWLIGLPERRITTHTTAAGVTASRTVDWEQDPSTGMLRAEVVEPTDPALRLRTEYQLDGFGNPNRITSRDAQGKSRATAIEYDSVEEAFPAVVTNGLGQQVRAARHPGLGVVVAMTGPSGAQTRYQYDGFGRLRAVDSSDGSDALVTYEWFTGGLMKVRRQHSNGSSELETFDKLGRVVQRETTGFDGQSVVEARVFDALGRVRETAAPHLISEPAQVFISNYDMMGRLLSETRPDGSSVQHRHFPDHREKVDANGNVSYVRYDAAGRVVESADDPFGSASLVTRFIYGPFDLPRQAQVVEGTAARVTTAMTYDVLGRRTLLEEYYGSSSTAGYRETSQHDAFGQLVQRIDAKGEATSYKYDVLGRLVRKTAPEGDTLFTWDTAPGAGVGRLASSVSPDGVAVSYSYDGLGRVADSTTTIDGRVYTVSRAYDGQGRLSEVGYPSVPNRARLRVLYAYNAFGHLAAVTDPSGQPYWQANAVDARGKVTAERFGNGVTAFHGFDPVRFVPTFSKTFDAEDQLLQDLSVEFDPNGNLTMRQDHVAPVREDFTYDSHNRLWTWTAAGPHVDNGLTKYIFGYDGFGRLLGRTVTAGSGTDNTITYDTSGARNPYAPVSSEYGSYVYDADGNQVSDGDRTVQWSSFNLPRRVDRSSGAWASYRYDSNQRRAVKASSSGETTTYVEGLYERRATAGQTLHVFHIQAAGRPVAQVEWKQVNSAVVEDVSYLHLDSLGSIDVISDGAGYLEERLRFDPFGARANPLNPTAPPETAGSGGRVRQGFTGHEMEDDFGLVNMRGRMYDPQLYHFMSRDPIVQSPFDPRAYNRYAYVGYNPMSFTDPSGFTGEPIIISTPGGSADGGSGIGFAPGSGWSSGRRHRSEQPERRSADDNAGPPQPPPIPKVEPAPGATAAAPASAAPSDAVDGRGTSQNFGMMYLPGPWGYRPPVHPVQIIVAMVEDLVDSIKGVYGFGGVETKGHGARGGEMGGERLGLVGYNRERGAWLGTLDAVGVSGDPLPTVMAGTESIYHLRDGSGETEHLLLVEKSMPIRKFEVPWVKIEASADLGVGGWVNRDHPDQLGAYLFFGPALEIGNLEPSSFVGIGIDIHYTFPRTERVWGQAFGSY